MKYAYLIFIIVGWGLLIFDWCTRTSEAAELSISLAALIFFCFAILTNAIAGEFNKLSNKS